MSSKQRKPDRKSRKLDSSVPQLPANSQRPRRGPVCPPPPLPQQPPPLRASEERDGRLYVWVNGARLSLPTAWLQHRISRLGDLDDTWSLYPLWLQDYRWWSGGSLPEDPQRSFRKVVAGCCARLGRRAQP